MRPTLALVPVFLLSVAACSGTTKDTSDSSTDTDTGGEDTDTAVEEVAVWEEERVETSYTLTGLYATPDAVYAVSQGGHSWVRSDGEWSGITTETDDNDLNDLWGTGVEAGIKMVAVGNGGVIATWPNPENDQPEWGMQDVGTANLNAIDGPAEDNLIAVGWGGVFANSSGTWEYQDVATGRRFNDVWYDGTSVMAVGEKGDFAVYNLDTWADDALPTQNTFYAVDGVSFDDLWAVGDAGLVAHWDGSSWTEQSITVPGEDTESETVGSSLWGVYVVSATEVYAVGNNGSSFVYDGSTWSTLVTGVDNNLYAIDGTSDGVLWAVGNRGMAITYDPPAATTSAR